MSLESGAEPEEEEEEEEVEESMTVRIEALSSRWRTRVTRQSTVAPTVGRGLAVIDDDAGCCCCCCCCWPRGTEMMGLRVLSEAGIVLELPMMDARILLPYTCVPGPGTCVEVEPRTWPGTQTVDVMMGAGCEKVSVVKNKKQIGLRGCQGW